MDKNTRSLTTTKRKFSNFNKGFKISLNNHSTQNSPKSARKGKIKINKNSEDKAIASLLEYEMLENPEYLEHWSFPRTRQPIISWNSQQNSKITHSKMFVQTEPQLNIVKRSLSSGKQQNFRVNKHKKQSIVAYPNIRSRQINSNSNQNMDFRETNNFEQRQNAIKWHANTRTKNFNKKQCHMNSIELYKYQSNQLLTNYKAMGIKELLNKIKLNSKLQQPQVLDDDKCKQMYKPKVEVTNRVRPAYTLWFNKVKERRKIFKKCDRSHFNKELILDQ